MKTDVKCEIPEQARTALTLLNVKQVCELLNVKMDWVYDAAKSGELPSVKLGRAVRFRPADLEDYLMRKLDEPSTD